MESVVNPEPKIVSATGYSGATENGSEANPYKTLSGALAEAWGVYTFISLLKGTHSFSALDTSDPNLYEDAFGNTNTQSPLESSVAKNTLRLTIDSF